jgi:energy-coupling factor transporter ATP-binding protein EcfA2
MDISPATKRHCETLFRGLRHTLLNRGLYRPCKDGDFQEVAWKRAILLPDLGVVAFEVDTLRLPVRIEQLLDPDVAHQIQATLNGRQVRVTNSRGLVFGVKLEPEEPKPKVRLPRRVLLDLDTRPEGTYIFPVGFGAVGPVWRSLLKTGHLLVGGETGSGKSTFLHAMLVALLHHHPPDELQVVIVDPKEVEFQAYRGLPHLFAPIATEVAEAAALTARLLAEMDRRRALFAHTGAKDLTAYNRHSSAPLPLLLLIVDEVTDIALQAGLKSDFYKDLIRLTSKGRAFGLVVVLATQNPKAEVLNTLIRGNLSTRVAFRVAAADHSRIILGISGAQELPRTVRGRMLARLDGQPVTLQGFYVSDLHRRLVQHAQQHLDGRFVIDKLWKAFGGEVGRDALMALARRWERVGWLAPQPNPAEARRVTDSLLELALEEER